LAQAVGIDTVGRFRSRDMMLGGQGAPMACYGHEKLWGNPDETIVVLNLGGIANISLLEEGRCTLGYDTGPANLWMDTLMGWHTEGKTKLDRDGQCAAKGTIDEAMLNTLLSHAYFQQTPPKSTGFEAFGEVDLSPQRDQWLSLSMEDALATANYATARSIADAIHHDSRIQGVTRLIACGGGAYNPVLIKNLQTLLPDIQVQTSNEMGFAPDTIEGLCFGLLAHACWHRIPANIPAVTGATSPCICGEIALASPAGS
jgi:anhydro-N-acetylmuramic acid kinase